MLSLLIPVYNWDVTRLVRQLHAQLIDIQISFEIIILDDVSEKSFQILHEPLQNLDYVSVIQNEKNLGRAEIRNRLASKAQYPYLLFMDCDAGICSDHFIQQYIDFINRHKQDVSYAVLGGVAYRNERPPANRYLRWYYGKRREEIPAKERELTPYRSFTPFNLLITKNIFEKISFDNQFTTYGNEDAFFGIALKSLQIPVFHIDNPLYHDGLDENNIYLQKIESSIKNLCRLLKEDKVGDALIENYRLLKLYTQLRRWYLLPLFAALYYPIAPYLKRCLLHSASMWKIDLFKLGTLVLEMNK